jgi:hypothetical protein
MRVQAFDVLEFRRFGDAGDCTDPNAGPACIPGDFERRR